MRTITAIVKQVVEWGYNSTKQYIDPFNEVELDICITHKDGDSWRIPTYWVGEQEWRVRFLPPKPGIYTATPVCQDQSFTDMDVTLEAVTGTTRNPLFIHGNLQINQSRRGFEHEDGTPFFWLGDTWWMGLSKRLSWPDDFQLLTTDRIRKGFSLIQIVAGLFPDMPAFDERGANEAGFPWEKDYARINPAYFDLADLRIQWLVKSGLMPCIVGAWGFHILLLGTEKMKQHWRYIIARWSAYPIVMCLAGEGSMPYYLSKDKDADRKTQVAEWTEVGKYVYANNPFSRLITIHPPQIGRDQVNDDSILDFDMLQSGHSGFDSAGYAVKCIMAERERKPTMPVMLGEVNYEGILHGNEAETQRLTFWSTFLSGSAGFSYGANGIWQLNTKEKIYGQSPHGATWGNTPWDEAYQLPGSTQLGLAKKLLEQYPWHEFEPHQEWVNNQGGPDKADGLFAAGIPKQIRVIYFYTPTYPWSPDRFHVVKLEPEVSYTAYFWDPRTGQKHNIGPIEADADNSWAIPIQPTMDDWVLVLAADNI